MKVVMTLEELRDYIRFMPDDEGQGPENSRVTGIRQGEAGCPREGYGIEAHT